MTIVDYSSLVAAVQDYAIRTDAAFIARIPDWVSWVENDINDRIKHRRMEIRATTVTVVGSAYVPVPSDFLEQRNFVLLDSSERVPLGSVSPAALEALFPIQDQGRPQAYAVIGNEARLMPIPDQNYTVEMFYYGMIPSLQANTTNWLITYHPRLYLYGVLKDAFAWLKDPEAAQMYDELYEDAVAKLDSSAKKEEWSTSSLRPVSDAPMW